MDLHKIQSTISESSAIKILIDDPKTLAVINIGSIPRGDYIHGWSDIDFMVFYDNNFDLEYSKKIRNIESDIFAQIGVKTGVSFLSGSDLNRASSFPHFGSLCVKFIEQFHPAVSYLNRGIIFVKDGFLLPVIEPEFFKKLDITTYSFEVRQYIEKLMISFVNENINRKAFLRKIIKNSLLLMQTDVLIKSGNLQVYFSKVVKDYCANFNTDALMASFSKSDHWCSIDDGDISDKEIEENLEILFKINKNISS